MAGHAGLRYAQAFRVVRFCALIAAVGACDVAKSPVENNDDAPPTPQVDLITDTTPPNIVLRPLIRYQTITGWEAHAQSGYESRDYQLFRSKLLSLAANDLAINRLRVEIRSGAENTIDYYTRWRSGAINDSTWRCVRFATVNDNTDPHVINWAGFKFAALDTLVRQVVLPLRQYMAARGERLHLNLTYVAFNKQICAGRQYHHDDSPQEYAEFMLATSLYLRNRYALTPDRWEVILEPDNTTFWRGPQIGRAIVATAAKLTANGYTPRFIAPSTARAYNAVPYFDQMLAMVPGAKPYLSELSYHRYSTPTLTELQTIAARAAQHGLRTGMLEKIGADHHSLHTDLKVARVSAWQQYALAFGSTDDGSQYYTINRTDPTNPTIIIGKRTKYLRQYFRFVRSGAVRIDATTSNAAVDPVAFINTSGKYVVILKSSSFARLAFSVQALPAGTYGLYSTNALGVITNWPDITITSGQALRSYITAKTTMTIYRK